MAYPARMSEYLLQSGANDAFRSSATAAQVTEPTLPPVTLLDSLLAWLATVGILLLLAGSVVVAGVVWFLNLLLSPSAPEEGVGE